MKTETYDDPQAFLAALTGKASRKPRGAKQRPDLPRAPRSEATGFSTLMLKGFNPEYVVGRGYRMWTWDGRDTGWCESERAMCEAAKLL